MTETADEARRRLVLAALILPVLCAAPVVPALSARAAEPEAPDEEEDDEEPREDQDDEEESEEGPLQQDFTHACGRCWDGHHWSWGGHPLHARPGRLLEARES